MSVIIVTGLLLLGGGLIGFIIYLQLKEQARIDKLRKVAALNNQTRQVRHYLDDLPAQYQPKDMRLWLFSRLLDIFDELQRLSPDEKTRNRRQRVAEELEVFKSSKQKRKAKAISDEMMVINLRRLLDSLSNFLEISVRNKKLDKETFERYSQSIAFNRYKLSSDNKAFVARRAFLSGNLEEAIELYKKALVDLEPIQGMDGCKELEDKLKQMVVEIESDLKLQQEEAARLAEQEDEELTEEWDKFMEDDDGFTKKRTF
ncbi:hypothetical protein CBF23_005375 [Marinomonas agarivorans]|nr:hypothetical protein CBF23_005375 [Marinomonas agarivorans]